METDIDLEKKVGKIFPMQGWVELHGCFTIAELSELIIKINLTYKEPESEKENKK